MASVALIFGSTVTDDIVESVYSLLSDQIKGATLLSVRPDPARPAVLLARIPERALQQAYDVVSEHPTATPHLQGGHASAPAGKINSSTAAAAAFGTDASSLDALQAGSCSSLNVTSAEAVLLAISCLERAKVRDGQHLLLLCYCCCSACALACKRCAALLVVCCLTCWPCARVEFQPQICIVRLFCNAIRQRRCCNSSCACGSFASADTSKSVISYASLLIACCHDDS
jgi:hypothetical protein